MRISRVATLAATGAILLLTVPPIAGALPQAAVESFQSSQACGCHGGLREQWSTSMHAKAIVDPAYLVKREEADKATGGKLGRFCDTCHAPIAVMSGQAGTASMAPQSAEGVTCDFCHQVTGTTQPIGNTSQTLIIDGTKRAQFADAKSPAHATAYSQFHETAEFCGACHNVDHPINGMHLEATYSEWKASPYAAQGIVCQDCHMTPGPGVTKPNPGTVAAGGPMRDHYYLMTFTGANVAQSNAAIATANLKAAAKLELAAPEVLPKGSSQEVSVRITNVGAGHYLPTGLTEVREMWLEVNAVSEDGKVTQLGRRDFVTVLKDAQGRYPVELWDAVGVQSDDRIPPQQSVTATYTFEMPSETSARIEAVLNYRSLPDEFAEKAKVENPVTEMAKATQTVWTSEEARSEVDTGSGSDSGSTTAILVAIALGAIVVVGVLGVRATRRERSS